ncbi:MAG: TetR/AcrR family transcriptional regulator [Bacillota bacterium]
MPKKTFFRLKEEKRNLIERAAITVINDKGYDNATIKDIVDKAGIPRGSFYQYFNGLSDLFIHLIGIIAERKFAYMGDLFNQIESVPLLELFPKLTYAGLMFAQDDREAYLFGYHLYHSQSEEVLNLRAQLETEGIRMMEGFLNKDVNKGWLKKKTDTKMLAKMLYDFNARDLVYQFYRGETIDLMIKRTNAFIEILTSGVKKEASND